MNQTKLNLGAYHAEGTIVLSGRPKGEQLRRELKLDRLDKQEDEVLVIVPTEIVSLNSSFFLGLFASSIRTLGADGFDQKYKFECSQPVLEDIEAGKLEAVNTSNPLRPPTA